MDLIVYIVVCVVVGAIRVLKNGSTGDLVVVETRNSSGVVISEIAPGKDLPIGNNYENYYDPDAFMLIIHELGLR